MASDDEVADAGEAEEGQRLAAQGDAEAGQLGQATGDERGQRVLPEPEPGGHARRDRDHVLDRSTDLTAGHVRVGVDPQSRGHQQLLDVGCYVLVSQGHHCGRRLPGENFAGDVRSGQDTDAVGLAAGEHLGRNL